jgi:hypothetical protein
VWRCRPRLGVVRDRPVGELIDIPVHHGTWRICLCQSPACDACGASRAGPDWRRDHLVVSRGDGAGEGGLLGYVMAACDTGGWGAGLLVVRVKCTVFPPLLRSGA